MKRIILTAIIAPVFLAAFTLIAVTKSSTVATHFPDCATGIGSVFNGSAVVLAGPDSGLRNGDVVAAFAGGVCVGQGMFTGQNFSFPIWRQDPLSVDVRGFNNGDTLTFRIYGERVARTPGTLEANEDSVYVLTGLNMGDNSAYVAAIDLLTEENVNLLDSLITFTQALEQAEAANDLLSGQVQDAAVENGLLSGKLSQIQDILNQ